MNRLFRQLICASFLPAMFFAATVRGQLPVLGDTYAHDPSRLTRVGNTYYLFYTSQGIVEKTSTDLRNWTDVSQVFPGNPPAWTTNAVPGFTGNFWAPDVIYLNGIYYLYYAVSTFELNIQRLDKDASGSLILQAQAGVGFKGRGAPTLQAFRFSVPPPTPDIPGEVAAISTAVGQLADGLAAMLVASPGRR